MRKLISFTNEQIVDRFCDDIIVQEALCVWAESSLRRIQFGHSVTHSFNVLDGDLMSVLTNRIEHYAAQMNTVEHEGYPPSDEL